MIPKKREKPELPAPKGNLLKLKVVRPILATWPLSYHRLIGISTLFFSLFFFSRESVVASQTYELENAFENLRFDRPVDLQSPRDGSGRLFVVEQSGTIRVVNPASGVSKAEIFLDIRDRVHDDGNEQGLLGLAFPPDYDAMGYFFVYYAAHSPRRTVLARFAVSESDFNAAVPDSEAVILEISQPFSNHKGGQIAFGPDGYLYVGTGDGGSAGDPHGNAQSLTSLLGKILRLDVRTLDYGHPYRIPESNPFRGNRQGFKEEIYAYGLRNPWRFSWDRYERLWAADVGQHRIEEINLIEKAGNYGWSVMEGSLCFKPEKDCNSKGLDFPVAEYDHSIGRCVIGGFVYEGSRALSLRGKYVFGDFVSGIIGAVTLDAELQKAKMEILMKSGLMITAFGRDESQELYVTAMDGAVYRFKQEKAA